MIFWFRSGTYLADIVPQHRACTDVADKGNSGRSLSLPPIFLLFVRGEAIIWPLGALHLLAIVWWP